jgi:preprotein translocase subunit SecA
MLAQATAAVAGANEHAARAEQSKRLAANTSSANNSDAFDRAMAVAEKAQAAREAASNGAPRKAAPSVGRNEPCPCGSGKKYKKCCGANS